jgi:DnaJ-domain-containing protein 1
MTRMRAEATKTAAAQGTCTCAWAGCEAPGVYKAPKDRSLSNYVMFCLDHVRAYNAKWDFHMHMSPEDIEAEIRRMVTWDRPTWPLGRNGGQAKARAWTPQGMHDPLDLGNGTAFDIKQRKQTRHTSWAEAQGFKAEERKALRVLDIDGPFTAAELKQRYKELVKQHHPDTNGGSREAEARMKAINAAHQTLVAALKRAPK